MTTPFIHQYNSFPHICRIMYKKIHISIHFTRNKNAIYNVQKKSTFLLPFTMNNNCILQGPLRTQGWLYLLPSVHVLILCAFRVTLHNTEEITEFLTNQRKWYLLCQPQVCRNWKTPRLWNSFSSRYATSKPSYWLIALSRNIRVCCVTGEEKNGLIAFWETRESKLHYKLLL